MSRPLASRRLAGTVRLTGLALRRDWPATAVWMITFAGLLTAAQAGFRETYPDAAALAAYALVVEASPVQHFFNGPGAGLASRGGMVVFEIGGYLLVVAAVVAILTTIRHSRRAEADSTGEMVRAGAVGCLAPLSSA
ncbi:MAG: hypothetical protein LBS56_06610 [Propionibacteriaceae bacterium]|jgi:ABC-2 type transport system permease protein|nr:hypothetical protein [Propionibacteriaceae bacterium]